MTDAAKPARLGLFGGTFDPIHLGHLRAAEETADALELERVIFLPAASPPHKRPADVIASAEERLRWVRLAIAGNPRFEVDPLELERGGRSYLVDTLRELRERHGEDPPVFVIGQDAFAEIESWREPETLFTLAHFAVLERPGSEPGGEEVELAPDGRSGRHRQAGTWIRRLAITALAVSATDIRRRLRENRSVRYLVPEPVREALLEAGAYVEPEAR